MSCPLDKGTEWMPGCFLFLNIRSFFRTDFSDAEAIQNRDTDKIGNC